MWEYQGGPYSSTNSWKQGGAGKIDELQRLGYMFAGIATPATNPGTPDGPVFYLATEVGIYPNFDDIKIAAEEAGEAAILEWKGSWVKKNSGLATSKVLSEVIDNIFLSIGEIKVLSNKGVYKDGEVLDTSGRNSGLIPVSEINFGISLEYLAISFYDVVSFFNKDKTFIGSINRGGGVLRSLTLLKSNFPANTEFIAISSSFTQESGKNFYRILGTANLQDLQKRVEENSNNISIVENKVESCKETISAIDAEFSEKETFVVDKKQYRVTATTAFGKISLVGLEKRTCTFTIKSNDSFKFGIYAYTPEEEYELIVNVPEGTDYSKGLSFKIDVTDLVSKGYYDNIKIRTWKTDVIIDYSLSYLKKSLSIEPDSISQWKNAIAALFGNSITAACNGDYEYDFNNSWGGIFAKKLGLHKLFARGVGGQTYKWNDGAYYCKAGSTGGYVGRYKAVDGSISQSNGQVSVNTTAEEKEAIEAVLGYQIEIHRGCFCSWDRITSMFPKSIKDTIQAVCIMGGTNDFGGVEEIESSGTDGSLKPLWSAENRTDTDWINAVGYYNGGDYDVKNTWGGMASCLMKMQVWMPQAKIIVLVPITRKGVNFNVPVNSVEATHQDLCESVKSVADWCNVETIDMNCCGINQFNIDDMLADGVHPSSKGQKRMGQYLATKFSCIVKFV